MPQFSYKGRKQSGEMISGVVDAPDQSSAAQTLMQRNVIPINIAEASGKAEVKDNLDLLNELLMPKISLDDLVIFSRQMFSLTKSGIPLLRAISGLADTSNSKRMTRTLRDVVEQLERGRNLSSALNLHPKVFNQLFVSIVHVGENTGKLDEAFLQLAEYLEREQETRKQIKSATRYPTFVVFALIAALVVMNIFVIPTFAGMFAKLGADLPAMTIFLLNMSDFFVNQWHLLLVGVIGGIFMLKRYLKTDQGRYKWDKYKLRLPAVGSIFERSLLSRFARSFSMMLSSGVPLTHALNLVSDAVDNSFMSSRIIEMRKSIEKGESLTRVAGSSGLFTPLVMQMIGVGEETGRVDELLTDVAEFYEREVDYDLKSLTSKIEPILIGIVSAMVLVLALGIFTPMWDMMNAYKS